MRAGLREYQDETRVCGRLVYGGGSVCCCVTDRLFFFFKQKTAYEIKECDWSSDVCSSDLYRQVRPVQVSVFHEHIGRIELDLAVKVYILGKVQIGRASCRERV